MAKPTNVAVFLGDLDGAFLDKIASALSLVGAAVIDHREKGKVKVEFVLTPLGSGYQLNVNHAVSFEQPTARGNKKETDANDTPMHFGREGITLFPEDQGRYSQSAAKFLTQQQAR